MVTYADTESVATVPMGVGDAVGVQNHWQLYHKMSSV